MYSSTDFANSFLDVDRAESVFELFFIFVQDDGSGVTDEQTFDSALRDIIGQVQLSEDVLARVQDIYNRTLRSRPLPYDSAMRLKRQLANERPLLVIVFSILLRFVLDDGMISRRDNELLREVFQVFQLTREELEFIPPELQDSLVYLLQNKKTDREETPRLVLSQHLETLECSSESSFEEIRSSYRRLVKRYHPDRQSPHGVGVHANRQRFEKVQTAYEAICQRKRSR